MPNKYSILSISAWFPLLYISWAIAAASAAELAAAVAAAVAALAAAVAAVAVVVAAVDAANALEDMLARYSICSISAWLPPP